MGPTLSPEAGASLNDILLRNPHADISSLAQQFNCTYKSVTERRRKLRERARLGTLHQPAKKGGRPRKPESFLRRIAKRRIVGSLDLPPNQTSPQHHSNPPLPTETVPMMATKRKADSMSSDFANMKPKRTDCSTAHALDFLRMAKDLGPEKVQSLLFAAYIAWPEVEHMVKESHTQLTAPPPKAVSNAKKAMAANKVVEQPVNFDARSKECWHALNTDHKRLKSSQQYSKVGEVMRVLGEGREDIMTRADIARPSRWETRRNALETMRKICKSVMLCELLVIKKEIVNGEVLGEYMGDMIKLAVNMTKRERQRYEEEGLLAKLVEMGEWDTAMPRLETLLEIFGVEEKTAANNNAGGNKRRVVEVIDLDGDSEEEVDEAERLEALKAFDRSRGCICHDVSTDQRSRKKSGKCPIHET